jgi:hypothetical protein
MRRYLWLAIAALALVAAAACRPLAAPAPAATPTATSPLLEALGYAPAQTTSFYFTDWAAIKAATGVAGPLPADERMDYFVSLMDAYATPSLFTQRNLERQWAVWGWDASDLEWEATLGAGEAPLYAVKFSPGVDLPALFARYRALDFAESELPHGLLFSHEIALGADWVQTELAFSNSAFLPEARIGLFSGSGEQLTALLASAARWRDEARVVETVAALGAVNGAALVDGAMLCGHPAITEAAVAAGVDTATLARYDLLAVGSREEAAGATATLAFHYGDEASAAADLAPRRALATEGLSSMRKAPYAETLFTVATSRVAQRTLLLEVTPVRQQNRRLYQMVNALDLLFAACP